MGSEKFCLRCNDFEQNIYSACKELKDDKDFFDVTLVCGNEQVEAHKVILCASSPIFRGILRRNRHQNPLLYLRGFKISDIQSILNFVYYGEVNVSQEDLNSFLAVAEDLQIKGLTQSHSVTKSSSQKVYKPARQKDDIDKKIIATSNKNCAKQLTAIVDEDDIRELIPPVKSEPSETLSGPTQ